MTSPLQIYNNEHRERWDVLNDVPEWINTPLISAVCGVYFTQYHEIRKDVVVNIERKMRLSIEGAVGLSLSSLDSLKIQLASGFRNGEQGALLLLDITIKYIRDYAPSSVPFWGNEVTDKQLLQHFDDILEDGSKWTVSYESNADSGIIERVDEHLLELANQVNNEHLAEAWNLAFKLKPEPEKAIISAQNAIEDIATEVGLTALTTNIYGGIIGDIRTNPGKYLSSAAKAYQLQDKINKQSNNYNDSFALWFKDGLDFIQLTNPARHKGQAVKGFTLDTEAGQQAVVMATILGWMIKNKLFFKPDKTTKRKAS